MLPKVSSLACFVLLTPWAADGVFALRLRRDVSGGTDVANEISSSQKSVGEYILSGLAASTSRTATNSTLAVALSTAAITGTPTQPIYGLNSSGNSYASSNAPSDSGASPNASLPLTGFGPAFASSCSSALWAWYSTSSSRALQPQYGTTSHLVPTTVAETITPLSGWSASRVTTLCDGHPRVIGSAVNTLISTTLFAYTVGSRVPASIANYSVPLPCTIGPSDCVALSDAFYSATRTNILHNTQTVFEPPCATNASPVPFQRTACPGNGAIAAVVGDSAQLLYWPVRGANESSDHLNITANAFCQNRLPSSRPTRPTIPGTPTISGKVNTFVTGSITITSPSVAIQVSGLHRADRCGPTIDTVVVMPPESVNSALGARALYYQFPFDYSDLNWVCENADDPSGPFTTQFVEGPNCYQDIPAFAYFYNFQRYDAYTYNSHKAQLTIANNYSPAVVPVYHLASMLTDVFGPSAAWNIDGIWDPPIALTQAGQAESASLPPVIQATLTSTQDSFTTPATPGEQNTLLSSPTSTLSPIHTYATTLSDTDVSGTPSQNAWPSHSSPTEGVNGWSSGDNSVHPDDGGYVTAIPLQHNPQSVIVVTIGTDTIMVSSAASGLIVDHSQTLTSGAATSIRGQQASWGSSGFIVGTGSSAVTVTSFQNANDVDTISIGNEAFQRSALTNDVEVLWNQHITVTVSPGGVAMTLNGQELSAASGSLIVSGTPQETAAVDNLVTVGTEVLTQTVSTASVQILSNQQTTFTLSPSGSAISYNGQTLSVGVEGLVVASDGHTSTKYASSPLTTGTKTALISTTTGMSMGNATRASGQASPNTSVSTTKSSRGVRTVEAHSISLIMLVIISVAFVIMIVA